jgi:hypothetical protein
METIFFAVFNSGKMRHDRMQYFASDKTLQEFFAWIIEKRNEIEETVKDNALTEDIKIIKNTVSEPPKP